MISLPLAAAPLIHMLPTHAGLGGSTVICVVYPFCEGNRNVLLVLVSLLGLCNSVAFSTSYQIVTHFATPNSVALTTGKTQSLTMQQDVNTLQWECSSIIIRRSRSTSCSQTEEYC